MANINNNYLKKIYLGLKKMKKKYVTSEMLSDVIALYPDVINATLAYFDPMVNMDYQYNLMDLLEQIELEIGDKPSSSKKSNNKKNKEDKIEKLPYDSINTFIYERMTIGGFMNRDIYLSDSDLKLLKKLVIQEQENRKSNKNNKKKRK